MSNQDKIKEQIEFYFSDSNYAKDKFMNEKAAEDDGFIPISVLMTFKRLQALNVSAEEIKEAVANSTIVELKNDSLRKIKTQEFLDYLSDKDISKRVVHISGLPTTYSLDDVKALLDKHFASVKITLRRDNDRNFTGCAFVELPSVEKAEEVLSMNKETDEQAKKIKTNDEIFTQLSFISKNEYLESRMNGKEKTNKDKKFADKVKENFIPRLFNIEVDGEADIKDIKQVIPNVAFVDLTKKVIRMKFIEEWTENEFTIPEKDGRKATSIKMTKMTEDQARDYLKDITIKKVARK